MAHADSPKGTALDYLARGWNAIASLAGHLLWHGVDPEVVTELLVCWSTARSHPPLPLAEVVRTVESITRPHLKQTQDQA
ncbi:MAG: primase C-terminal domain-containing protein [Pseudomonadota bacterium]